MGNEFGHPEWIDFPRGDRVEVRRCNLKRVSSQPCWMRLISAPTGAKAIAWCLIIHPEASLSPDLSSYNQSAINCFQLSLSMSTRAATFRSTRAS
jgi:hypothetical protein